jgi:hypothetical protein
MVENGNCTHCHDPLVEDDNYHHEEHEGLCCGCFDLSVGMPLRQLNAERAEKGKKPVQAWPRTISREEP